MELTMVARKAITRAQAVRLPLPKTSSVQLMPHGGTREAPHRVGRVVVYQGWRFGQEPRAARAVAGAVGRSRCPDAAVRAENPVHRSDQQSCTSRRPAVMITDHVPAVRIPPDHAGGRMAAAVAA